VIAVLSPSTAMKLPGDVNPADGGDRVVQALQDDRVLYSNQPVAVAMADTFERALHAASLVLWTSGVALVGGAVSAKAELGMSFFQFFSALPAAVPEVNLWLGVGKGVVFGVLIALIACHFGLRIQPNTEKPRGGDDSFGGDFDHCGHRRRRDYRGHLLRRGLELK